MEGVDAQVGIKKRKFPSIKKNTQNQKITKKKIYLYLQHAKILQKKVQNPQNLTKKCNVIQ